MELNEELTAQQSLDLITKTLNNSRRDITRDGGKYFILWGILLAVFSLIVYALWKSTGRAEWNFLWFAMPLVGYPLSAALKKRSESVPDNLVSELISKTWRIFAVFAISVSALIMLSSFLIKDKLAGMFLSVSITPSILMLFGISESFSGILLKSPIVIAGGLVVGIGGLLVYYLSGLLVEQMLIFTFAGIVLALTGVLMKNQKN